MQLIEVEENVERNSIRRADKDESTPTNFDNILQFTVNTLVVLSYFWGEFFELLLN